MACPVEKNLNGGVKIASRFIGTNVKCSRPLRADYRVFDFKEKNCYNVTVEKVTQRSETKFMRLYPVMTVMKVRFAYEEVASYGCDS